MDRIQELDDLEMHSGLHVVSRSQLRNTALLIDKRLSVDAGYERDRSSMERYSLKELNAVDNYYGTYDRLTTSQLKEQLLAKVKLANMFEDQIVIGAHILWFIINAAGAVVLGVLLNSAPFDGARKEGQERTWFAIGLFFPFMGVKIVSLCRDVFMMARMGNASHRLSL